MVRPSLLPSTAVFRRVAAVVLFGWVSAFPNAVVLSQVPVPDAAPQPAIAPEEDEPIDAPKQVDVEGVADDDDIERRLAGIFEATGLFRTVDVRVDDGVAFLSGVAETDAGIEWAERVAQATTDVVGVINDIRPAPRAWYAPAVDQLATLRSDLIQTSPLVLIALAVGVAFYFLSRLASKLTRFATRRSVDSVLLRQVIGSVVAVLVFVAGIYLALRITGLSRLAVSVLGGTGLVGLALGFAFRDIAENYLSSILISLNRPFGVGDLIEVESHKGFVRRVTTRGTLLLTMDGNHIQIPNSTVYKSVITNFTASPKARREFSVGIGYEDPISKAQTVIRDLVRSHEAVLDDPSPIVLVEELAASTVNLRCLFWLDIEHYDPLKVTSALMRMTKVRLTENGISMPDEAREIIFPKGVPVLMNEDATSAADKKPVKPGDASEQSDAEGGLRSDDETLQRDIGDQAMSDGETLVGPDDPTVAV